MAVSGGTRAYPAGQVAWEQDQHIVGRGDPLTQTRQELKDIETVLKEVGVGREHIASLRIYIAHEHMASRCHTSTALCESFPKQFCPSSTWIVVQGLAGEEFLVEIEAVAHIEPLAGIAGLDQP